MVGMTTNDSCNVEDLARDVANLRQYRGVTVRVPALCKRSSVSTLGSRSKNSSRSENLIKRPEYSSSISTRLATDFNSPACDDMLRRYTELCYSNCCHVGSALSCLIRPRLSSPFTPSKASFSPSSLSRRRTHLSTIAIVLLMLHSTLTSAYSSSVTKLPLTRTEANPSNGLRKFTGVGPMVTAKKASYNKGQSAESPRFRLTPRNKYISDHFQLNFQTLKVVKQWGNHTKDVILVGGSDYIYMINSTFTKGHIRYMERLKWASGMESASACLQMGKLKYECKNFIRVIEVMEDGRLYVCGTNSYSPRCRHYSRDNFSSTDPSDYNFNSHFDDEAICGRQCECPYNPTTSSVNLYADTSNGHQLFTAVINDFMGKKPVLMRKNNPYVYSLQKWFNDPTFIRMIDSGDGKIYLFFRETSTPTEAGTSKQTTFARVAQVCKNDEGGKTVLRFQWTTFQKARLHCALSGTERGPGFTFNNLTSVSDVTRVAGPGGREMDVIFATFTTPWDWSDMSMSAVCVYSMDAIRNLFETGLFLGKQELRSQHDDIPTLYKAVPVSPDDVPDPRPGRCSTSSSMTNHNTLSFAKDHFLMYDPIMPFNEQPIYISETGLRATQLTVDGNAGDGSFPLVYIGTEDGRILRLRPRLQYDSGPKALLLEEKRVAKEKKCASGRLQCGVLALHVSRPASSNEPDSSGSNLNSPPSLFVAFTDRLAQLPLSGCRQYVNEACCSVDPDCGWIEEKCIVRTARNRRRLSAISNMADVPTNCQAPLEPKPCKLEDTDPILRDALCVEYCGKSAAPTRGCLSSQRKAKSETPLTRSLVQIRNKEINDEPDISTSCANKKARPGTADAEITDIFTERVLPLVSDDFRATLETLQPEQRQALMTQLQEALETTTKLVLRNHKKEYCLLSPSVNGLTHTYPILLREIEAWHSIALKKMTSRGLQRVCWEEHNPQHCPTRISFSSSFPPTLWKPLTNLVEEFGAICDPLPSSASTESYTSGCDSVHGLLACKDEHSNNPLCQPKRCRFKQFAVDVKAFFRHVNDSRRFLAADKGLEPLWKPVNVSMSATESIKGHLELLINDDTDNPQHFEMQYIPTAEKVKITFFYIPVRECSWNERSCAGTTHECNPRLEKGLRSWFESVMAGMKASSKKCIKQVQKLNRKSRFLSTDRQHSRRRRSTSSIADNQIRQNIPSRCRFVKKSSKLPLGLWDHVVRRAQSRGGIYSDIHERIEFFSTEDIKVFFDNHCLTEQRDERHENLGRTFNKKRKRIQVEIVASLEMPFVIEKQSSNRVKLKYFTRIVR